MFRKKQSKLAIISDILPKAKKKHTKKKAAVAVGVVGTAVAVIANEALKNEDTQ